MRKIEQKMNSAIRKHVDWHEGNTAVVVDYIGKNTVDVFLHDNLIYMESNGEISFSFRGWNTVTTRSRLNALGLDVRSKNFTPYVNGVKVNEFDIYTIVDGKPVKRF